jgi:hypothetical protein
MKSCRQKARKTQQESCITTNKLSLDEISGGEDRVIDPQQVGRSRKGNFQSHATRSQLTCERLRTSTLERQRPEINCFIVVRLMSLVYGDRRWVFGMTPVAGGSTTHRFIVIRRSVGVAF